MQLRYAIDTKYGQIQVWARAVEDGHIAVVDGSQYNLPAMQAPIHRTLPAPQRILTGVAGVAVVILAAGAIGYVLGHSSAERSTAEAAASAAAAKQSRLKDAYDRCHASDSENTLELGDGGDTIVIDTRSEYGSTTGMDCVLGVLKTPQSIQDSTIHQGADGSHDRNDGRPGR